MDGTITSDFNPLNEGQINALNDEQRAIFQLLSSHDRTFFANHFPPKDLPAALTRKGEIMKRNQMQRDRLTALQEKLAQADQKLPPKEGSNDTGFGNLATGAAAAMGIGAIAHTISTDGTASWQGVSPRLISNTLERVFDDNKTTDIEVEGVEDNLTTTVYLRPPDGSAYVPALTVSLIQVQDILQVKVSDLTSESLMETAKQGGKKILDLAAKGLIFWQRRRGIFIGDAVTLAQSALDTVFNAAQVARDLDLEDRVWQVIKETADAREKAYKVETGRLRLARQDLETAWDDYYRCPRCNEPYARESVNCRICGRARNEPPQLTDPRKAS